MRSFILLVGISCCIGIGLPAVAQQEDSLTDDYKAALSVYHSLLTPETGLYKGNEYTNYSNTITDGTPFFDPVPFDTGSVVYHNILYRNVPIAYDIVKDEVVIYDMPRLHTLSLIRNEVSRFRTSGYSFIHLTKDSIGAARLKNGFYQVLYEGNIIMLKKETRNIQERSTIQATFERYIEGSSDYFIEKKGVYYSVNNKSSFLSALRDKEKALKTFIRKKRLKFRKSRDTDFAQAAAYYDTLTK